MITEAIIPSGKFTVPLDRAGMSTTLHSFSYAQSRVFVRTALLAFSSLFWSW